MVQCHHQAASRHPGKRPCQVAGEIQECGNAGRQALLLGRILGGSSHHGPPLCELPHRRHLQRGAALQRAGRRGIAGTVGRSALWGHCKNGVGIHAGIALGRLYILCRAGGCSNAAIHGPPRLAAGRKSRMAEYQHHDSDGEPRPADQRHYVVLRRAGTTGN